MPVKHTKEPDPSIPVIRDAFQKQSLDMFDVNADRFMGLLNASQDKCVKLTFTLSIDTMDSETKVDVGLGFGQRYTDKRTTTIPDPSQLTMFTPASASQGDEPSGDGQTYQGSQFDGTAPAPDAKPEKPKKGRGRPKKEKAVIVEAMEQEAAAVGEIVDNDPFGVAESA